MAEAPALSVCFAFLDQINSVRGIFSSLCSLDTRACALLNYCSSCLCVFVSCYKVMELLRIFCMISRLAGSGFEKLKKSIRILHVTTIFFPFAVTEKLIWSEESHFASNALPVLVFSLQVVSKLC